MKKILATLILVFSFSIMANAQVFLIDEDVTNPRTQNSGFNIDNPAWYGSGEDWYTPIGDGALLLAALGGAYLLGKKNKKK